MTHQCVLLRRMSSKHCLRLWCTTRNNRRWLLLRKNYLQGIKHKWRTILSQMASLALRRWRLMCTISLLTGLSPQHVMWEEAFRSLILKRTRCSCSLYVSRKCLNSRQLTLRNKLKTWLYCRNLKLGSNRTSLSIGQADRHLRSTTRRSQYLHKTYPQRRSFSRKRSSNLCKDSTPPWSNQKISLTPSAY